MSRRVDNLVSINLDIKKLVHGWQTKDFADGKVRSQDHAGLVDQLRDSLTMTSGSDSGNASGKPTTPQMPGSEGALSLVVEIETEAGRLATLLGATAPSGALARNLAFIELACGTSEDPEVEEVARTLGRLVRMAEVELDWSEPPRRLHAKCPACKTFGSVSVWMDVLGPAGASCSACEEQWSRSDLGHLGALVQDEEGA